jgi:hypothetical protein
MVGRAGTERVGKVTGGGSNPNRFRLERFGKAMAGLGGVGGGVAW